MGTVNYFDWNMGVNDETLHSGIIKNTNYVNGSGNKKYFSGDLEFSFSEDDDPIKNYQILEGYLLPQGNNLEVEIIPSTGSDTYIIKDCYEIKHVARYLKSGIEAIISSSVITLSFGPSITITNYDSRFTSNDLGGILACRITNPNTNDTYLRSFTISGQDITLKSITADSDGIYQIQGITGISTNWRFELISAFDIVKSGTQLESVFQGYVIKTIENGEGTIKFTKFDTPEKLSNEFVAIVYVKLEKMKPQDINMESILQHDIFTDTKQIDFALIQSQLDLLKENLIKYNNPLRKVILKTRRPTILKRGEEVYFNVTDVVQDTLKVIDINEEYINQNGEIEDKPFRVITYTFANYIDDFAKLLSTFQLKDEINKIQLAKKQQFNYTAELIISCTNQLDTSNNATFVSKPKNLSYEFTNANSEPQDNYLILSWDTVTEATDYYVEISLNNTFTHLILAGFSANYNQIETYSEFTINNNLFYARVKTQNRGIFSEWSDTLEIEKIIPKDYVTDSNTLLYYRFQENTGTNINDETANNRDSTITGSSSWQSGIISGDTSSLYLSGNSNTATSNFAPALTDFTARVTFRFNTGDKSAKATHILVSRYDTLTGISTVSGADIICEFDPTINKFLFTVYQSNTLYRTFEASYTVLENTDYSVQFAFKLNHLGTNLFEICVNGLKLSTTLNSQNISNISSIQNSNIPLMVGAYRASSGTYYRGQFRALRVAFDNRFRTESEAFADYNNLFN